MVMTVIWGVFLACHWSTAIVIQQLHVPAVLGVCMGEAVCYYWTWKVYNEKGDAGWGLVGAALVMNSAKHTFARVLLLMVSMGYGITVPHLRYSLRITLLGVVFFACNLGYMIVLQASHMRPIQVINVMLVSLPVSFTNSLFLVWIFSSLADTIKRLKETEQAFKLRIFQQLAGLFGLAIGLGVVWFGLECYYRFERSKEDGWQIWWRFEAAWHLLFALTIAGILVLWRPTSRSKDLAYTMELAARGIEMQKAEEDA